MRQWDHRLHARKCYSLNLNNPSRMLFERDLFSICAVSNLCIVKVSPASFSQEEVGGKRKSEATPENSFLVCLCNLRQNIFTSCTKFDEEHDMQKKLHNLKSNLKMKITPEKNVALLFTPPLFLFIFFLLKYSFAPYF